MPIVVESPDVVLSPATNERSTFTRRIRKLDVID